MRALRPLFPEDLSSETQLFESFLRQPVSALLVQERTIVLSYHYWIRGRNYKSSLLNTVRLLSTDSILTLSSQR